MNTILHSRMKKRATQSDMIYTVAPPLTEGMFREFCESRLPSKLLSEPFSFKDEAKIGQMSHFDDKSVRKHGETDLK